jgi:hypothetical protein
MAMTTMPSGLSILRGDSAFRTVLPTPLNHSPFGDPDNALVPVNTSPFPDILLKAFAIPGVDFDQACPALPSRIAAPFRIPLPFMVRPKIPWFHE